MYSLRYRSHWNKLYVYKCLTPISSLSSQNYNNYSSGRTINEFEIRKTPQTIKDSVNRVIGLDQRLDYLKDFTETDDLHPNANEVIELGDVDPEEFNAMKADFMGVHRSFDLNEKEKIARKKITLQARTRKKHFKEPKPPPLLTIAEIYQIQHLHKQDPHEWSPELLALSFPATSSMIKRILKNVQSRKTIEQMMAYDKKVFDNWLLFRSDRLPGLSFEYKEHLKSFLHRSHVVGSKEDYIQFLPPAPVKYRTKKTEFRDIITKYYHALSIKKKENKLAAAAQIGNNTKSMSLLNENNNQMKQIEQGKQTTYILDKKNNDFENVKKYKRIDERQDDHQNKFNEKIDIENNDFENGKRNIRETTEGRNDGQNYLEVSERKRILNESIQNNKRNLFLKERNGKPKFKEERIKIVSYDFETIMKKELETTLEEIEKFSGEIQRGGIENYERFEETVGQINVSREATSLILGSKEATRKKETAISVTENEPINAESNETSFQINENNQNNTENLFENINESSEPITLSLETKETTNKEGIHMKCVDTEKASSKTNEVLNQLNKLTEQDIDSLGANNTIVANDVDLVTKENEFLNEILTEDFKIYEKECLTGQRKNSKKMKDNANILIKEDNDNSHKKTVVNEDIDTNVTYDALEAKSRTLFEMSMNRKQSFQQNEYETYSKEKHNRRNSYNQLKTNLDFTSDGYYEQSFRRFHSTSGYNSNKNDSINENCEDNSNELSDKSNDEGTYDKNVTMYKTRPSHYRQLPPSEPIKYKFIKDDNAEYDGKWRRIKPRGSYTSSYDQKQASQLNEYDTFTDENYNERSNHNKLKTNLDLEGINYSKQSYRRFHNSCEYKNNKNDSNNENYENESNADTREKSDDLISTHQMDRSNDKGTYDKNVTMYKTRPSHYRQLPPSEPIKYKFIKDVNEEYDGKWRRIKPRGSYTSSDDNVRRNMNTQCKENYYEHEDHFENDENMFENDDHGSFKMGKYANGNANNRMRNDFKSNDVLDYRNTGIETKDSFSKSIEEMDSVFNSNNEKYDDNAALRESNKKSIINERSETSTSFSNIETNSSFLNETSNAIHSETNDCVESFVKPNANPPDVNNFDYSVEQTHEPSQNVNVNQNATMYKTRPKHYDEYLYTKQRELAKLNVASDSKNDTFDGKWRRIPGGFNANGGARMGNLRRPGESGRMGAYDDIDGDFRERDEFCVNDNFKTRNDADRYSGLRHEFGSDTNDDSIEKFENEDRCGGHLNSNKSMVPFESSSSSISYVTPYETALSTPSMMARGQSDVQEQKLLEEPKKFSSYIEEDMPSRSYNTHFTLNEFESMIKKKKSLESDEKIILDTNSSMRRRRRRGEAAALRNEYNSQQDVSSELFTGLVSSMTKSVEEKELEVVASGFIQTKIKIPKDQYEEDAIYKVDDCFYDSAGDFLYRVPGLKNI